MHYRSPIQFENRVCSVSTTSSNHGQQSAALSSLFPPWLHRPGAHTLFLSWALQVSDLQWQREDGAYADETAASKTSRNGGWTWLQALVCGARGAAHVLNNLALCWGKFPCVNQVYLKTFSQVILFLFLFFIFIYSQV